MAVAVTVEGVEAILRGFAGLSKGVQRKYLGSSVREVVKSAVPEVKALTPKGPTGNLKRSVGLKLEKKKTSTAVGIVGYRRAAGGSNRELGFHAWWIENGVKVRTSKSGKALKVPMANARKYPYLKGKVALVGGDNNSIFFRQVKGFEGTGKFAAWAEANMPRLKDQLIGKLENNLSKAIAEEERRLLRAKFGKAK
jgi:hypothetical protein